MGSAALRCPPGTHGAWPPERPLVPATLNDMQGLYPLMSHLPESSEPFGKVGGALFAHE